MTRKHSRRRLLKYGAAAGLLAAAAANVAAARAPSPSAASASVKGKAKNSAKGESMGSEMLVGYCGIYCGLCDRRKRVPERAAALRQAMEKAEAGAPKQFWETLKELAEWPEDKCCRTGKCGDDACAIRNCVKAKGLTVCPECGEYPCEKVKLFGECEPLLLADGLRIKTKGLEAWLKEQEQRRADGFCYADIRCYPYYFPRE